MITLTPDSSVPCSGYAVESSVRYIPFMAVFETLWPWLEEQMDEWLSFTMDEKAEWLMEMLPSHGFEYDAKYESDYDYTYIEVDDYGVVLDGAHVFW